MASFGRPRARAQYQPTKSGQMYTQLHETQGDVATQLLRCDKRKGRLQKALRHSRNKLAKNLVETKKRGQRPKPATHNHLGIAIGGATPDEKRGSEVNVRSTAFVVDSFVNYQSMLGSTAANAKLTKGASEIDLADLVFGPGTNRYGESDEKQDEQEEEAPMTAKQKAKAILLKRMKPPLRALRTSILVARAVYRWKALVARRRVLKELEFREMFLPQEPVLQPRDDFEDGEEFYPGLRTPGQGTGLGSSKQPSTQVASERGRATTDDAATVRSKYGHDFTTPRLARSYTSHISHVSQSSRHHQGPESLFPQHQLRPPTSPRIPRPDVLKRAIPSESQRTALEKRNADRELQAKILFERRNPLMTTILTGLPAKAKVVPVNQTKLAVYEKAEKMSPRKPRHARRSSTSHTQSERTLTAATPTPEEQDAADIKEEEPVEVHARRQAGLRPSTAPSDHQVNVARVSAARRVAMADRSWNRKNRPPSHHLSRGSPRARVPRRPLSGSQNIAPLSPVSPIATKKAHSTQNTPLKSALKSSTPRSHHVRIADD